MDHAASHLLRTPTRAWFRFSLRSLLAFMLATAVLIWSMRFGYLPGAIALGMVGTLAGALLAFSRSRRNLKGFLGTAVGGGFGASAATIVHLTFGCCYPELSTFGVQATIDAILILSMMFGGGAFVCGLCATILIWPVLDWRRETVRGRLRLQHSLRIQSESPPDA